MTTTAKDEQLQAWVGRHPGWAYLVTQDGRHVVKAPSGLPVANDPDPAAALETARSWS